MSRRIDTDYQEEQTSLPVKGIVETVVTRVVKAQVTDRLKRDFAKALSGPLNVLYLAAALLVLAFLSKLLAFVLSVLFWPLLILAVAAALGSAVYAAVVHG